MGTPKVTYIQQREYGTVRYGTLLRSEPQHRYHI